MDSICEGRFDAAQDKVSVIARALGQEQSPACRAESLRLMARCAPIGCPVSVGAGAKPRVVAAAVRVCAAHLCMCGAGPCFRRSLARLAGLVGHHAAHFWVCMSKSKSVLALSSPAHYPVRCAELDMLRRA